MLEKIALTIVGSEWFWAAVVTVAVRWLAGWWLTATGQKWLRYEGWVVTAVKAAEKAIPDDVANKGLQRLNFALVTFLKKYKEATGKTPDDEALAEIEGLIGVVHAELEAGGGLEVG